MKKIYLFGIIFIASFLPLHGMVTEYNPSFEITPYDALYMGYVEIGKSGVTSFEVTCIDYTGSAYATVGAPFEVSTDGVNFSDTVHFNSPGTTIYVRFTPTNDGYEYSTFKLVAPGVMDRTAYVNGYGIVCDHTIPYSFNFNSSQTDCWSIVDANNDGASFVFATTNYMAYYNYSSTNPADDWLISPDFQLDGNQIGYFNYCAKSSSYQERFQVLALGDDTIPLSPVIETNTTTYQTLYLDLSSLNGTYRIGIHCISDANKYRLQISNFNIVDNSPRIVFHPSSITFSPTAPMKTSPSGTATVTSIGNVSGSVILSAPTPFELSLDGITYSSTLTLQRGNEAIHTDTFLIRFAPMSYESGNIQGVLTASFAGIQDSLPLTGTVIDCEDTIPYTFNFDNDKTDCWTVVNSNNDDKQFQFYEYNHYASYNYHQTNPADDWLISPMFEFDGNQYGFFEYKTAINFLERFQVFALGADTIPLSSIVDTSINNWTTQMLNCSVLNGSYRIGIHCISAPDMYYLRITNFNILPIVPAISILPDSLTYHLTPVGSTTPSQQLIVSTMGITSPVVVTAPEYFEISSDGVIYSQSLTLPPASTAMHLDTVFVRFAPTTAGSFTSFLTVSGAGLSDTLLLKGASRDCNAAIPLPFEEGFEGDFSYCWTIIDQDGFGDSWTPITAYNRSGVQCAKSSAIYDNYTGQYYLDNWLISQPIQLTDSALLTFYVKANGYLPPLYVYLSTTGNNVEDFTTELYISSTSFATTGFYDQVVVPLYEYVGQTVYIAFRHYKQNSNSTLYLDDISIATPQDHPLIEVSENYKSFGATGYGEAKIRTVEVTGHGLSNSITATVPAPYSLSADGVNYAETIALPAEGGLLYIRYIATSSSGSQDIILSSPGANDETIQLYGYGIECYNTIPYTHLFKLRNDCWEVVDANEDGQHFYFNTSTTSYAYIYTTDSGDDWLISPTLPLDGNQYGFFEYGNNDKPGYFQVFATGPDTVPLTDMILVENNRSQDGMKTVRFDLSAFNGAYRIGIHTIQSQNPSTLYFSNFNVLNITPILEFETDTLDFGVFPTNTGVDPVRPAILSTVGINTPITITATGPFEISLNGTDYSSSLTIPASSAGAAYDTIFVRMPMIMNVEFTGLLTATAGDLQDSVSLAGSIFECPNTIPYSYSFNDEQLNNCWTVVNANWDNRTFEFIMSYSYVRYGYHSQNAADDWLISPVFQLNGNQFASFEYRSSSSTAAERFEVVAFGAEDTVLLMPPTDALSPNFKSQFVDLSGLNGDYQIGIHCISDPSAYYFYVKNFKVENFVPTLTVNEQQVDFGDLVSHALPETQQLVVNGSGVFAPITITAPTGYEVSLDNITFSGSVSIPARDYGFTSDTFYVKFNPAIEGFYDNLLIVSANNCADTVQLFGSIFYCEGPYQLPIIEDFEDALGSCWHISDLDGDSYSWIPTSEAPNGDIGHENTNGYVSMAYTSINYGINQINCLLTPMFVPTQNTVLAYYIKGTEGIPQHYYIYVASEDSLSAFLYTEPILDDTVGGTWEEIAMSLADYAGDTVFVAFLHYGKNMGSLTIDDLVITDNLDHPVVLTDSSSVSFGTVMVGKNATRQVDLTTFGLSGTMVATTTSPFTLSVDGTTFASYANIPASGGPLYIRYSPTSGGDDNGTVTLYIPGGQTRTIAVSGSGFDCLNTIPYSYQFDDSYISCWSVENSNGDYRTFSFDTLHSRVYYVYHGSNAADDWLISPTFQFNGNQYGHFDYYCHHSSYPERFEVLAIGTDTVLLVAPMEITNTEAQTLNIDLTGLSGEYAIAIHCISDPNRYFFYIEDFNILNVTPTIIVDEDSLAFEMIPLNSSSNAQQLAISTVGVNTPITVSVPLPFEISADNITFSNTVVLPPSSNLLGYDTLYVRFSPTSLNPAQNTLTLTSGNAQATVALTGTSRDCDAVLSLPIFEGFEGASNYCWNSLDQDGDGHYWYVNNTSHSHAGSQCAYSASFLSSTGTLYPDNWLVSQPIQLPDLPARLSFWIKETAEYYGHEYYSVYISTTGNSTTDFTDVLTSGYATPTYEQQSISLREYAGQTVWIAFRHHYCYNVYQLVLDDIDIRLDTVPQLPMVVTDSVFSITQMSAVCIGHTVFDGNATVTSCGFVWSTSPNPTLANDVVNSTPGMPTLIGMLSGLSEHTTYYVRAFATNSIGTEYGEEIVFTTLCGPATYTNFSQSACESFTWNDSTYFESGDYTQQLTNVIGCDSIVTMHLTIYHSDTTEFAEAACESFVWNNATYNQSGDYTQSFTNIHGCDSIVTLHLTLNHAETAEFAETACDMFVWNDSVYTASGDYTQHFQTVHGCDSVVTLHLTLNYAETAEFAETACDMFVWNDSVYTASGDYTQHFQTVHGCDSVVTLHLTLNYAETAEFSETACDTFVWNDSVYTASGDYTQHFQTVHGCDSVVTLHLTLNYAETVEFAETACDTFVWNDSVYTASGDYTQHFLTVHGCDSVVTLHLTLYPSVSNEETISWPDSCYIWNGEEYCTSGDYTQTLTTVHGCDSTVTLHLTITVGIEDFVMENDLRVYPNPTNGVLQISGTAFDEVQLFDTYGKLLGSWRTDGNVSQIDLSRHAAGVYFVKALNRSQVVGVRKVLKR